jgi:hypothetical protein
VGVPAARQDAGKLAPQMTELGTPGEQRGNAPCVVKNYQILPKRASRRAGSFVRLMCELWD